MFVFVQKSDNLLTSNHPRDKLVNIHLIWFFKDLFLSLFDLQFFIFHRELKVKVLRLTWTVTVTVTSHNSQTDNLLQKQPSQIWNLMFCSFSFSYCCFCYFYCYFLFSKQDIVPRVCFAIHTYLLAMVRNVDIYVTKSIQSGSRNVKTKVKVAQSCSCHSAV